MNKRLNRTTSTPNDKDLTRYSHFGAQTTSTHGASGPIESSSTQQNIVEIRSRCNFFCRVGDMCNKGGQGRGVSHFNRIAGMLADPPRLATQCSWEAESDASLTIGYNNRLSRPASSLIESIPSCPPQSTPKTRLHPSLIKPRNRLCQKTDSSIANSVGSNSTNGFWSRQRMLRYLCWNVQSSSPSRVPIWMSSSWCELAV